tara:strand:- start:4738 stop:4923 length:186 start_codon:yes stop_codon:yes gene_type:complete
MIVCEKKIKIMLPIVIVDILIINPIAKSKKNPDAKIITVPPGKEKLKNNNKKEKYNNKEKK